MAIFVDNVLDVYTVEAINELLANSEIFEDGKLTAGKTAKKVKENLQAKPDNAAISGATKKLESALLKNAIFNAAAQPKAFAKIMFSRYEPGMAYGEHVDDAFIAGVRTDLSFTLFLSSPDSYDGGELIIRRDDGDEAVKLPAGALYLYPSTSLHRVAPVTKGTRLVAVGWVQSRLRLEAHRDIIFDISSALKILPDTEENLQSRLRLLKAKANLMRLWAD